MDETLKLVKPYGRLYTQGKEYYLLVPHSIPRDSWQGDNCYTFLVTPTEYIDSEIANGEKIGVCRYARHIITNNFTIELKDDIKDIAIPKSEIGNYDKEELENEDAEKEFPF